MSRISRTPFNSARLLTKILNSNKTIVESESGIYYFVDASSPIELNLSHLTKGSYYKFIIRDGTQSLTITAESLSGVMLHDNGGISVVEGSGTQVSLSAGSSEGSYIDLVCDGEKWYVQGLAHGAEWTIS